ncbi:MAG: hypothetical protein Q9164_002035 [Protoblastenia rupestris]
MTAKLFKKPWLILETLPECPGYPDGLDLVLRNQNKVAKAGSERHRKQRSGTQSPATIASPIGSPAKSLREFEEAHSLCFFVSSWVDYSPDPQAERGFVELLPLLYPRTKMGSPLSLCVSAISHLVFNKWEHNMQNAETLQVKEIYGKALTAMRHALRDPIVSLTDETLLAVCLLGWYEACIEAMRAKMSSPRHFEGAAALIKHRQGHLMTNLAKKMLVGVRSHLVHRAIHSASPIDVNANVWHELQDFPHTPATLLDLLTVEVANILAKADGSPQNLWKIRGEPAVHTEDPNILSRAVALDAKLATWQNATPSHWAPERVSKNQIPENVIQAGLYGQIADIYQDVIICSTWNDWRIARLKNLALIAQRTSGEQRGETIGIIQELVDAICASIPFCLGSRRTPAPLHTADVTYPTLPGQKTPKLHHQTAAAYGGWYLLAPMRQVMAMEMYLREGQIMWMHSQLKRLATIYDVIPAT